MRTWPLVIGCVGAIVVIAAAIVAVHRHYYSATAVRAVRSDVVAVATWANPEGPGLAQVDHRTPDRAKLLHMLPADLPDQPGQGLWCTGGYGYFVQLSLRNGDAVTYGPCHVPAAIATAVQRMHDAEAAAGAP